MINLQALQKALATIGEVGKGELAVEVDGVAVVFRVLTADEDMDAQRYARTPDDGEEEVEALVLLERYKRTVLAHSIIQIGDMDLRNESYIATGEVTEKGVPVRKPRHIVVRGIIDGWARITTMALFQKYLELQRRVDFDAEKAIHFDVEDISTEIARVEKRLSDLKKALERSDVFRSSGAASSTVASVGAALQQQARNVAEVAGGNMPAAMSLEEDVADPASVEPAPPPVARQRVGPVSGAPPTPPPAPRPPPMPPTPEPASAKYDAMMDSLGDGPEQIAAETARLIAARQASRRQSLDVAATEPPVIETPIRRQPPHREAANASDVVLDEGVGNTRAARTSGPRSDLETHRLDSVLLSERGPQPPPANQRVPVNAGPKTGPTNPRFRGK